MDVAAYRRRLLGVMKRGSNSGGKVPDLVRNPSLAALDRELMHRMQKKVEMMVGKSNMLSAIEGAFDGMEVRAVDDYNARNSLCKGASLGALQFKALMCGCPQAMQVLVKRVPRPDERLQSSGGINTAGFDIGAMALPWKVSMFLVPKAWATPRTKSRRLTGQTSSFRRRDLLRTPAIQGSRAPSAKHEQA